MKLGDTLKHARESKELTVQAVADAIHLSVKQINALETNNFSLLPEPVTTRGFIRSYARFLEIDSEPLLTNYRELVPHQDPNTIVISASVNKVISAEEKSPWLMYILGSIVVLLLLVVWFYYMDNVNEWAAEPDDEIALESPVELAADASTADASQPESISEEPTDEQVEGEELVAVVAEAAQTVESNKEFSPANTVPAITEPLVLRLKEDCWVSIKTLNGTTFFEKLLPAGTEQGFAIQPPFKLKIGNATAASATYKNQALDLAAYTRGSVARLTVNDALLSSMANSTQAEAASAAATTQTLQVTTENAEVKVNPETALLIKTQEACWVSVKTAAGQKVFEQLLPAGANQVITVAKPFNLTIGNASAAQASYNNQALDLETNKQHNVAKLKIE